MLNNSLRVLQHILHVIIPIMPQTLPVIQSLMNLWHGRLGHPNKVILNKVLAHLGISVPTGAVHQFCDAC